MSHKLVSNPQIPNSKITRKTFYLLLDKLGVGGNSDVWLAHGSDAFGNLVVGTKDEIIANKKDLFAIKFFPLYYKNKSIVEISALKRLIHPNIPVPVEYIRHHVDGKLEKYAIVLEYIDGKPLNSLYEEPNKLTRLSTSILQLGSALEAVHEAGIVHTDIKPENILITPTGKIKLIDFGNSRESGSKTPAELYRVEGTIAYTSPEIWTNREVSSRTDIYSLAVMLTNLISGNDTTPTKIPFASSTKITSQVSSHLAFYDWHMNGGLKSKIDSSNLKYQVKKVLAKAGAVDPNMRYGSALEFCTELVQAFE